ncbi:inositol monophosphatase family protein [Sphingomonas qilianensis]|uniref:Inositol monophosphatase family protein n=1 Tax=Sphingomonas qilianensis TaxID=1736690 RepID=A0ABU9XRE1_9SPHN
MHPLYDPVAAAMREVASAIILPRFRNLAAGEVRDKAPGDPVTIADQESEARLTEALAALTPGNRVVGEEAASDDLSLLGDLGQGRIWVIDPLDGTKNFAEGKTPFAVMVALLDEGRCEAGWILDPVSGRMCHAVRGGGMFFDGARVMARPTGAAQPRAAIALHFLLPERRADIETRAAGRLDLVAIPRCAGEQYPRLIDGQNDIALFERTMPWDHLAGALMVEEAGGKVARPDGSDYRAAIGGKGLLAAASPALWETGAATLFG